MKSLYAIALIFIFLVELMHAAPKSVGFREDDDKFEALSSADDSGDNNDLKKVPFFIFWCVFCQTDWMHTEI